ncbi:MAG: cyclic nucleotide-binding domain-containing protein [Rubrivivax sp.]
MTRQGAAAHWLYLIASGEAEVYWEAPDGERRLLTRLSAGNVFGEMGLMTGAPRSATVVAAGDVECYRLDKAGFEDGCTPGLHWPRRWRTCLPSGSSTTKRCATSCAGRMAMPAHRSSTPRSCAASAISSGWAERLSLALSRTQNGHLELKGLAAASPLS